MVTSLGLEDTMRQRLLLLLASRGYDAVEAANIVGILMTEPFLGPMVSGDAPQMLPQGVSVQRLAAGIFYFAPSK